ncbi:MAG: (2Fe-2S)-binding protein [Desulfobacterales bacterium]|nr:(2Fe-2S)-binding protein [Desulfobacterales bacterium]
MTNNISLTINGLEVKAAEGATILEAAEQAGIYIPTLCHCPDITPEGVCRICLIKIEKKKKLHPACRTPVEEGMTVITDDPEIEQVRRVTLELILSDHDFNCLLCPKSGTCRLQELVNRIGFDERRLNRLNRVAKDLPIDTSNPFFDFNPNKCIHCGICVRTCREIVGVDAIDMGYRGYELKVSTFGDKPFKESVCASCGECVQRCPTAALIPKKIEYPTREVKPTCAYCGVGCGLYLGVRGNSIVKARGDPENPANRGELCVRGRFGNEFIHSPHRLSSPLVRAYDPLERVSHGIDETGPPGKPITSPLVKREGNFVEVNWDQAIKYVASTLLHYKGDQFAAISSAKCTNEENYLFQKFVRTVMGTNNIDHCARL